MYQPIKFVDEHVWKFESCAMMLEKEVGLRNLEHFAVCTQPDNSLESHQMENTASNGYFCWRKVFLPARLCAKEYEFQDFLSTYCT